MAPRPSAHGENDVGATCRRSKEKLTGAKRKVRESPMGTHRSALLTLVRARGRNSDIVDRQESLPVCAVSNGGSRKPKNSRSKYKSQQVDGSGTEKVH